MTVSKVPEFYISEFAGNFGIKRCSLYKNTTYKFPEVIKDKYEELVCGPKIDYGLSSCSKPRSGSMGLEMTGPPHNKGSKYLACIYRN